MDQTNPSLDHELHSEFHAELLDEFGRETEPWIPERLSRVMARLNAVRTDGVPLAAHCLWVPAFTAFTTPAPHIYVTRPLMERLSSDEMIAFILGHEIAHHDLGHLELFRGWLGALPRGVGGSLTAAVFRQFEDRLYGPEREAAADRYAVEICLDAGYDGLRCLHALDLLEQDRLNRGDVNGVFGPENLLDPTDPGQGGAAYAVQRWLWIQAHRYLPVRERRDRAVAFYELRRKERDEKEDPTPGTRAP